MYLKGRFVKNLTTWEWTYDTSIFILALKLSLLQPPKKSIALKKLVALKQIC